MTGNIPSIDQSVIRSLLDELDQGCADTRGIHAGEQLTGTGAGSGNPLDREVIETGPIKHQGSHFRRYRFAGANAVGRRLKISRFP
jgi:hypothetical protein